MWDMIRGLDRIGYSIVDGCGCRLGASEMDFLASCICVRSQHADMTWMDLPYSHKETYRTAVREMVDAIHSYGYGFEMTHPCEQGICLNDPSNGKWFHEPDVPLIISVTGHYNISPDYHGYMERELHRVFSDLRARCPHTRMVLMTALDEGTDMTVSRIALEEGAFLAPVFPMHFDEYMGMRPGRDIDAVDAILSHERCFDPHIIDLGVKDTDAFRFLAVHLVSRAHLMISVWDGNGADHNGGAFDTTDMAINGIEPDLKDRYARAYNGCIGINKVNYLDISDDCPVFLIRCERGSGDGVPKDGV